MMYRKIIYILLLVVFGCTKESNWKGVGNFKIKRQESYNYSEMLSGELDSTSKSELEKYKEQSLDKMNNTNKLSIKNRTIRVLTGTIESIKIFFNNLFKSDKPDDKFKKKILKN